MQIDYPTLLIVMLIPYLLFISAYYLRYKNKEPWIIRKFIHTSGLTIGAMYGAVITTVEELIIYLGIFLVSVLIFSVIPQIQLIQNLIYMGTRVGERELVSLINTTLTVLAAIILLLVVGEEKWIFFAGVMSVALGDGLGEFIGKPLGKHQYNIFSKKSIEGSIGVFVGSYLGGLLALLVFQFFSWWIVFLLIISSAVATIIEAFSVSFVDNVLMPYGVAGILWYFG